MPGWTTSPVPPHPWVVRALDVVFPRRYPLDPPRKLFQHGRGAYDALVRAPTPAYPFDKAESPLMHALVSERFYDASLRSVYPLAFAVVYYVAAHILNGVVRRNGSYDYVRRSVLLRWAVLAHNAALMVFSAWTWLHVFPVALDYFSQGVRAAGFEGLKLSLCTFSTEAVYMNKYNYLFYLSKYYEVFDSIILLLKGKQVGQLQSYHHAGALISMWIAVRYGSECVWVFTTWNSFVHTLMYTYYLFTALHLPFPRALKRSLTTLQIAQIASGTLVTNLHWLPRLRPRVVLAGIKKRHVGSAIAALGSSSLRRFFSAGRGSSSFAPSASAYSHLDLAHNARLRQGTSDPSSCFDTTGATFALWVNTLYMLPLLALFAQFFVKSYLHRPKSIKTNGHSKHSK